MKIFQYFIKSFNSETVNYKIIFNGSPKKLKCSRCSFIWTSSSKGEPIDVPKLFEPSSTQGLKVKDENQEKFDKNIKPDHPLPVLFNKPETNKSDFIFWILLLLLFVCLFVYLN